MMLHHRRGFTLLELMISLSIFVLVMSLVMDTLANVSNYSYQEAHQDDMSLEGRNSSVQITNDIANSAWLYDFNTSLHQLITTGVPNTVGYVPQTPYPNNPLLPWVWVDTTSTAPNEKDCLEYVKIRTSSTIATSPYAEHYFTNNLRNPSNPTQVASVVTLDQYATAPSSPFLIVNPNYPAAPGLDDIYISHVWESSTAGLTFDQNMTSNWLRHYHLEVINVQTIQTTPTVIQTGQLVRTYFNGQGSGQPTPGSDNGTWNSSDIQILAYDVQSFVVHTQYQEGVNGSGQNIELGPNQVSFSIVQTKPTASAGVYVTHTTTFVSSMRSITYQ